MTVMQKFLYIWEKLYKNLFCPLGPWFKQKFPLDVYSIFKHLFFPGAAAGNVLVQQWSLCEVAIELVLSGAGAENVLVQWSSLHYYSSTGSTL